MAGVNVEEVEAYNQTLGRLFKWLLLAVKARKEDIIRRKAHFVKASERRAQIIEARRLRLEKKEEDLVKEEEKFGEDHKEEIEAFRKYEQMEQEKKEDEYGDENADEEEPKEKLP